MCLCNSNEGNIAQQSLESFLCSSSVHLTVFFFPFHITFTTGCNASINLDDIVTLRESKEKKKCSYNKYHQKEIANIELGSLNYELR